MSKYQLTINGKTLTVSLIERTADRIRFEADGTVHDVSIKPVIEQRTAAPAQTRVTAPAAAPAASNGTKTDGAVCAPMPGLIVKIAVSEGQSVKSGDTLLVMEAMKMENNISSPCDGQISKIHVQPGNEVQARQVLVSFN